MAKLTEPQKYEIVSLLAQFVSPANVVVHMREWSCIEIDRFQVRSYDPTNARYEGGDKWRLVFDEVRRAYLASLADIPIAHAAFRLNELHRNYLKARDSGNLVMANATLEQAAKEAGGLLTNERKIKIDETRDAIRDMTPEERRVAVVQMLDAALKRKINAEAGKLQ
jgi:hypothetical protein